MAFIMMEWGGINSNVDWSDPIHFFHTLMVCGTYHLMFRAFQAKCGMKYQHPCHKKQLEHEADQPSNPVERIPLQS